MKTKIGEGLKIKKARFTNIQSIQDLELVFKNSGATIVAANGTGKSTILHALEYMLSEDKKYLPESIIKVGETEGSVSIDLEDEMGNHFSYNLNVSKDGDSVKKKIRLECPELGLKWNKKSDRDAFLGERGIFDINNFIKLQSNKAGRERLNRDLWSKVLQIDIEQEEAIIKQIGSELSEIRKDLKTRLGAFKSQDLDPEEVLNESIVPEQTIDKEIEKAAKGLKLAANSKSAIEKIQADIRGAQNQIHQAEKTIEESDQSIREEEETIKHRQQTRLAEVSSQIEALLKEEEELTASIDKGIFQNSITQSHKEIILRAQKTIKEAEEAEEAASKELSNISEQDIPDYDLVKEEHDRLIQRKQRMKTYAQLKGSAEEYFALQEKEAEKANSLIEAKKGLSDKISTGKEDVLPKGYALVYNDSIQSIVLMHKSPDGEYLPVDENHLNTAARMRLGVDIAIHLLKNSKARFITLHDSTSLDFNSLRELKERFKEEGIQAFLEKAHSAAPDITVYDLELDEIEVEQDLINKAKNE